ncbi:hypothetical protein [Pseudomonas aeruginosa]
MLDEALAIFLEPQHQALARLLVAFSCFLRERRIDQGEIALDGQQRLDLLQPALDIGQLAGHLADLDQGKGIDIQQALSGGIHGGTPAGRQGGGMSGSACQNSTVRYSS